MLEAQHPLVLTSPVGWSATYIIEENFARNTSSCCLLRAETARTDRIELPCCLRRYLRSIISGIYRCRRQLRSPLRPELANDIALNAWPCSASTLPRCQLKNFVAGSIDFYSHPLNHLLNLRPFFHHHHPHHHYHYQQYHKHHHLLPSFPTFSRIRSYSSFSISLTFSFSFSIGYKNV